MKFIPEKIQLLFIEDNEESASITINLLQQDKYTDFNITHKSDLKSGLKFLEKECKTFESCSVDIVLLDLVLPNSEGVDTYIKVREACPFLPIVIVSRHEDIACECVKMGAQDFLVKSDLNTGVITRSIKYAIARKRLEDERVMLENEFRNVITSTPLGVHMYKLEGDDLIFIGYNPAADKILKVDNSQYIGKSINEAFPGLDPYIEENYRGVIKTGKAWNEDVVEYKGEYIKGSYRVHAFRTGSNTIATSFEDVTVRAQMENDLKNSEKKYRDLVEATNAGIYEIDFVNDRFTYVNDVMCELTGWSREELLGMGPSSMLTEKSIEEWIKRWDALNKGEYIEKTFEYEAKIKDGSTIWTLVTAEYKENEEGLVVGARVVAIDITEAKTIRKEIKEKEEIIFDALENRIHQWREELTETGLKTENQIRDVSSNIQSITNNSGVH